MPKTTASAAPTTDATSLEQVRERLEAAGYPVKPGKAEADQVEALEYAEGPSGTYGVTIALYKTTEAAASAAASFGASEGIANQQEQVRLYSTLADSETLSAGAKKDFEEIVEIAEGRSTTSAPKATSEETRTKAIACLKTIGAVGPLDTELPGKIRRNTPDKEGVIAVTLHRNADEAAAELKEHDEDEYSPFDMQLVGDVTVWATGGNEKMLAALAECMGK